jgi:hypothetical protein
VVEPRIIGRLLEEFDAVREEKSDPRVGSTPSFHTRGIKQQENGTWL